jgi:hypothetical protein
VKDKRRIFQDLKKAQKAARQDHGRSERRLNAEIEEDILHPLDIDSSAYHGGALARNAIHWLMEHTEDVAIGMKQKLLACNFEDRNQEVEDFTIGIRLRLYYRYQVGSAIARCYIFFAADEIWNKLQTRFSKT